MISKITERYILCRDIQVSTEEKQFSIEMISKMTEPCILCGDNQIPTEKSVQHRNDFKDQRTLHSLLGDSNPNWKTQIIIEMITKMTAPYILCWDIQVSNERSLHLSLGHLKSNWKKQFSIQMISKMTEPYIICGDLQIPTEKDSSALTWFQGSQSFTSLRGDSDPNWERQFSIEMLKRMTKTNIACGVIPNPNWKGKFIIEMITNMSESYIICTDIQIPIDRTLHLLLGHSNSNWKRQFSI